MSYYWGKPYSTGGWNCGVCGTFVMHNTMHICMGPSVYPPCIPAPQPIEGQVLEAWSSDSELIVEKLNEIIELLKEIKRRAA